MYATLTLITKVVCCVTYVSTAAFNDCCSVSMPYTVLANSYWISVYDAHQNQGHAYKR